MNRIIESTEPAGTLFAIAAGLIGSVQWRLFRNGLSAWWIGANAATGFLFGSLDHFLYNYNNSSWPLENFLLLIILWASINFVAGMILIRKAKPVFAGTSPIVEAGTRTNSFMILLSVSLILAAVVDILAKLESYDFMYTFWFLYGVSAVLAGVSYFLKKDIPRNFGFIALAIYLLFDGILGLILAIDHENRLISFLLVSGIIALASGVFFISQKETWKNLGFLMLSSDLIVDGLAGVTFVLYDTSVGTNVWFISSFFAIPAAILFLLRK
jgi:hypothetical protein